MRFMFLIFVFCTGVLTGLAPKPGAAQYRQVACTGLERQPVACIRTAHFVQDTCAAIETLSRHHKLDTGFFARLLWQESRFDPHAVSHAGAQGIAQFMPHTAKRRALANAFNPAEAMDRSAEYLAEMTEKYGNIGLAAVGYNGGERRAEGIIAGTGGLMQETHDYVRIITGMTAADWLAPDVKTPDLRLDKETDFQTACVKMAQNRRISAPPEPEKPALAPWGVQLAFGDNRKQALSRYEDKTKSCRHVLKNENPDLVKIKNRVSGRKGFLMVRVGRPSLHEARKFCLRLSELGCKCQVSRNF